MLIILNAANFSTNGLVREQFAIIVSASIEPTWISSFLGHFGIKWFIWLPDYFVILVIVSTFANHGLKVTWIQYFLWIILLPLFSSGDKKLLSVHLVT